MRCESVQFVNEHVTLAREQSTYINGTRSRFEQRCDGLWPPARPHVDFAFLFPYCRISGSGSGHTTMANGYCQCSKQCIYKKSCIWCMLTKYIWFSSFSGKYDTNRSAHDAFTESPVGKRNCLPVIKEFIDEKVRSITGFDLSLAKFKAIHG